MPIIAKSANNGSNNRLRSVQGLEEYLKSCRKWHKHGLVTAGFDPFRGWKQILPLAMCDRPV
jgi:hypothetical protein